MADKSLQEATNNAQRFRPMMQALLDLMDAAGEVNQLNALYSEASARLEEKQKQEAELDSRLAGKQASLDEWGQHIADVEVRAEKKKQEAKTDAERILLTAGTDAASILTTAKSDAAELTRKAKEELAELQKQLESKRGDLGKLVDSIVDRTQEHQQLKLKIEEGQPVLKLIEDAKKVMKG